MGRVDSVKFSLKPYVHENHVRLDLRNYLNRFLPSRNYADDIMTKLRQTLAQMIGCYSLVFNNYNSGRTHF